MENLIYGYTDEQLFEITKAKKHNNEDYFRIECHTSEFRFSKSGKLQQKLTIEHIYKNDKGYHGYGSEIYDVWLDVPTEE